MWMSVSFSSHRQVGKELVILSMFSIFRPNLICHYHRKPIEFDHIDDVCDEPQTKDDYSDPHGDVEMKIDLEQRNEQATDANSQRIESAAHFWPSLTLSKASSTEALSINHYAWIFLC